jgi:hypothetical protein
MTDSDDKAAADKSGNEGEGNRTAARAYDQKAEQFAKSGKVEQKAHEAKLAVDGTEGKDLAEAEAAGKARGTAAGRADHKKP